jgi:hypothetical protein
MVGVHSGTFLRARDCAAHRHVPCDPLLGGVEGGDVKVQLAHQPGIHQHPHARQLPHPPVVLQHSQPAPALSREEP